MKFLILACIIYSVTASGDLTDEQKNKLRAYKVACVEETGARPDVLREYAASGNVLPENEQEFGCFSSCLLQKTGVLTADGKIHDGVFRSKVPADLPKEKVDEIVDSCSKRIGSNLCQTGGNLLKCFNENKAFEILS